MKALMNLQPYCEACPYFDGVLKDTRQKVFANDSVYPVQLGAELTIEIRCGNENICKRMAEVSTSTALAYEKEMESLGKLEGVRVDV